MAGAGHRWWCGERFGFFDALITETALFQGWRRSHIQVLSADQESIMRSYPRNSPEAAARIVALVLISDGHVCRSEIDALSRLQLEQALGLAPGAFAQVVHNLCEDLLMGAYGNGSMMCCVDDATLASLLAELDEPERQSQVLRLASAAAEADNHLSDAEALVVAAARRQWCIDEPAWPPVAPSAHGAAAVMLQAR